MHIAPGIRKININKQKRISLYIPGSRYSALLQLLQPVQSGANAEFRSGGDARDTGASHYL